MKKVEESSAAENAYGKKLDTPVKYSFSFDAYETIEEIKTANDMPKDSEIVSFRNNQRKANARQQSLQAALDAAGIVRPTLENDEQLRLRKMYDIFVANGSSHEEARASASAALNLQWAE